jgi:hypothetical protein
MSLAHAISYADADLDFELPQNASPDAQAQTIIPHATHEP